MILRLESCGKCAGFRKWTAKQTDGSIGKCRVARKPLKIFNLTKIHPTCRLREMGVKHQEEAVNLIRTLEEARA